MGKTHRKLPINRPFRQPRVESTRRQEMAVVDELLEGGFNPSNRVKSRVRTIPSAWDDIDISALAEIPKMLW